MLPQRIAHLIFEMSNINSVIQRLCTVDNQDFVISCFLYIF